MGDRDRHLASYGSDGQAGDVVSTTDVHGARVPRSAERQRVAPLSSTAVAAGVAA
jgi:hypothetical protein